jgi:predicted CoA-binding protein
METKKTLVIGASTNPERYSNKAARRLLSHNHPIELLGLRDGEIEGHKIDTTQKSYVDVDTVTLYINPGIQKSYYDYLIGLHPKRIIFNPGAENAELEVLAKDNNIEVVEACTLVLLGTNQY